MDIPFDSAAVEQAIKNIETACDRHEILKSSFFKSVKSRFGYDQLKMFLVQQFYVSRQFPQCLAILYGHLPDVDVAATLVQDFLAVEHWGSKVKDSHPHHYLKTLKFFGLDPEELKASKPSPSTKNFLDTRLRYFLKESPERALGAMTYGHEYINGQIFTLLHEGFAKVEGITDEALEYFATHTRDEPEDYQRLKNIVISLCKNINVAQHIQMGATEMLGHRNSFFIGLHHEIDRMK